MRSRLSIIVIALIPALLFAGRSGIAQDNESELAQIEELVDKLGKAFGEEDWETFEQSMTEEGFLQFKRHIVESTFIWMTDEIAIPLKDVSEFRERFTTVYSEHGVQKLEFANMSMVDGEDFYDAYEELIARQDAAADAILVQTMNQTGLLLALLEILRETPMPQMADELFQSDTILKIEKEEEVLFVTVRYTPSEPMDEEGIFVSQQDVFLRFVPHEDGWRYDGIDLVKSLKATLDSIPPPPPPPIRPIDRIDR